MNMMSQLPAMRLYWSSRSPFVRKAMIAAHETGISTRIETIRVEVAVTKLNTDVMAHNPLNKIPTLVLENGEVLFDSRVICEYFTSLSVVRLAISTSATPTTIGAEGAPNWQSGTRGLQNAIQSNRRHTQMST